MGLGYPQGVSPARVDIPRQQRLGNATEVLRGVWSAESFTASDVIAATGLTRSTVLGLCADLLARGWIQELEDSRAAGQYSKGRPARRYAFCSRAGYVVGVDAGQHRFLRAAIHEPPDAVDDEARRNTP